MFGLEPPSKRQRLDVVDHGRSPTKTATATVAEAASTPEGERETDRNSTKWPSSQPHPHPQAPSNYQEPTSYASPHSAANIRTVETSNTDPFHSSPGSWYQDGFSQDPGFLASQEELRAILFTLANSAAPTRASSPETAKRELDLDSNASPTTSVSRSYQRQLHEQRRRRESPLSSRRRIEYLKNYVAEIAPWVRTVTFPTFPLFYVIYKLTSAIYSSTCLTPTAHFANNSLHSLTPSQRCSTQSLPSPHAKWNANPASRTGTTV